MAILVTFLGYSWIIFAKCEKSLEKWQFLNAHKKLTIRDMHEVFFCASRPLEIDCFQYFYSFLQCHMDQGNNHNQKDWRSDEDKFQSPGRTFFDQKRCIVQKPRPGNSHTPYGCLVFIHPLMIKWFRTRFLCVNFFLFVIICHKIWAKMTWQEKIWKATALDACFLQDYCFSSPSQLFSEFFVISRWHSSHLL